MGILSLTSSGMLPPPRRSTETSTMMRVVVKMTGCAAVGTPRLRANAMAPRRPRGEIDEKSIPFNAKRMQYRQTKPQFAVKY